MSPHRTARGIRRELALALVIALPAGWACVDRSTPDWSGVPGPEERGIAVSVTSHHFLDVVIYAGRDGSWHRLGTVTGVGSAWFDVPEGLAAPPGQLRLRAHPIGAPDAGDYVTETILANPGDVIELTVAGRVRMSNWHIRSTS